MKKLMIITALVLGTASAQSVSSVRLNAPDEIIANVGLTNSGVLSLQSTKLYGNVTFRERLYLGPDYNITGQVVIGNNYDDLSRVYVEGQLAYTKANYTVLGVVRQGVFSDKNFGNYGTSYRLGVQGRF